MSKQILTILLIIITSHCNASEKAAFITMTYHTFKEPKEFTEKSNESLNQGPNHKSKHCYNEVEKYIKCFVCICYPCFWAKATKK
jgi:hypothetical protein